MGDGDSPFTHRDDQEAKDLPTTTTTLPPSASEPPPTVDPADPDSLDAYIAWKMEQEQREYDNAQKDDEEEEVARGITGEPWTSRAWGRDQEIPEYWYSKDDPGGAAGEMFDKGLRTGRIEGKRTPQYTANDPMNILNSMSTAQLAALELQFVDAGYIDEDEILGGNRGSMISVFTGLVTSADYDRISWEDQLQNDIDYKTAWDEANPEEKPQTWAEANPWSAPVYLAPDYATLAQSTKATIRDELGRSVTSGEMQLLTSFLATEDKKQWKANEYDVSLADWEGNARAHEAESNNMSATTVQGVDAVSRFGEMFDERYAGEIQHRKNVETTAGKQSDLFGSIDALSRMSS